MLSWKLGDSGFFIKSGFGFFAPIGNISGPTGLGNAGHPWWTLVPSLTASYIKDGWNLTSSFYLETNTASTVTGYRGGDVFHGEFSAIKTVGKWSFGPVGYYFGQVSDDKSSARCGYAINVNRYNVAAVGARVGYDFGPVAMNVWGTSDVLANTSGGSPVERATITKGFNLFTSLSFRLWAPDEPTAPKMLYKK